MSIFQFYSVNCNNGTCVDLVNSYKCQCLQGYYGGFLDSVDDPKFESKCWSNANFDFFPSTGKHCEQDINMCELNNPCKNHGKNFFFNSVSGYLGWIQKQTNYYMNYKQQPAKESAKELTKQPAKKLTAPYSSASWRKWGGKVFLCDPLPHGNTQLANWKRRIDIVCLLRIGISDKF